MREATGTFEAIAASNAMTIRVLFTAGWLHTPGKPPARDESSSHPELTTNHTGKLAPATREQLNNLLFSYGAVHSGYALGIPDGFQLAREQTTDDLAPGL